jgi:predicted lipoprotein with Yx(FWY)xxD motif
MRRTAVTIMLALLLMGCADAEDPGDAEGASGGATSSTTPSTASPSPTASPSRQDSPTPTPTPVDRTGTVVVVAGSDYGPMLFDGTGQAIYLFDKETSRTPRCYGPCADAWPPVLTEGLPRARRGTDQSLLGTVRRRDGAMQVTYGGHPLYYYAHEAKNQVLCHDVREYGGLWLVVRPNGAAAPSAG